MVKATIMHRVTLLTGFLLLSLAHIPAVYANAAITGTVSDQNNSPLGGVDIQVYNGQTLVNQVSTNPSGGYTTASLPPATYRVVPVKAGVGFTSETQPIPGYRFNPVDATVTVGAAGTSLFANFKATETEVAVLENRIKNGNFELGRDTVPPINHGHSPWGGQGWGNVMYGGYNSGMNVVESYVNGSLYLEMVDAAARSTVYNGKVLDVPLHASQNIQDIVGGQNYRFSMRMKTIGLVHSDAYAGLTWGATSVGTPIRTDLLGSTSGNTDWHTVSQVITAPANAKSVLIDLRIQHRSVGSGDNNGIAEFDDLQLYRVELMPNKIQNGTWEENVIITSNPGHQPWGGMGWGTVTATVSGIDVVPGNGGLVALLADSASRTTVYNGNTLDVPLYATQSILGIVGGGDYRFSMKMKTENLVNSDAFAQLTWSSTEMGVTHIPGVADIRLDLTNGNTDWRDFTSSVLTAPATAKKAEIKLTINHRVVGTGDNNGRAYIDNVRLWRVDRAGVGGPTGNQTPGRIQGRIFNDANSNGNWDSASGELLVRDTSSTCANSDAAGIVINGSGPTPFTSRLTGCSGGPLYDSGMTLQPGTYTLTVTMPTGWILAGPVGPVTIQLAAGQTVDRWYAVRQGTVTPVPQPDLVVDSIAINPATPLVGQPFTITATIKNLGTTSSPTSHTAFQITNLDTEPTYANVTAISPTMSATVSVTRTLNAAGSALVHVTANGDQSVTESRMDNNNSSKSFTVSTSPKPDLMVNSVTVDPALPAIAGKTTRLLVEVKNQGLIEAPASALLLQVSTLGELIESAPRLNVPPLAAGASQTVSREVLLPASALSLAGKAVVDPDNQIAEVGDVTPIGAAVPINGLNNSKVFTLAVVPNHKPTVTAQTLTTAEDTALPVTLQGADLDGDPITFQVTTPPLHGEVTQGNTDPSRMIYTPSANFVGSDGFSVAANDGKGIGLVARIGITVTQVNDAPHCEPALGEVSASSGVGTPPIRANCTDPETAATLLQYQWEYGDGIVAYPAANPTSHIYQRPGTYHIRVTAFDLGGNSAGVITPRLSSNIAEGTVVVVRGPNRIPTATTPTAQTTLEETPLHITLAGNDPDGDPITFLVGNGVMPRQLLYGILSGTPPQLTYTPTVNAARATDSFTYTVSDNQGGTSLPATVRIAITNVNDAPSCDAIAPVNAVAGVLTTVRITCRELDGQAMTYRWAYGDGTFSPDPNPTAMTTTHVYQQAGTYTVTARVRDTDQTETAVNGTVTVSPAPKTDLSVTNLVVSPTIVSVGHAFILSAYARNPSTVIGHVASRGQLRIKQNGVVVQSYDFTVPALGVNGSSAMQKLSLTLPAAGSYEAQAEVDLDHVVDEANEANNIQSLTFQVQ